MSHRFLIDSGSNAAIAAIVDAVGVDAIERELRDVGVRSTSLRSRSDRRVTSSGSKGWTR